MKKLIAVILALSMLVIPVHAEESKNIQDELVLRAKEVCDIGDEYDEFRVSYIRDEGNVTVYSLEWESEDENIDVEIGSDGIVYGYDNNYYSGGSAKNNIISDTQAREIGEGFLKEALLDKYDSLSYKSFRNSDSRYTFIYNIKEDDIAYLYNMVEIAVNKYTGNILYYNYDTAILYVENTGFEGAGIDKAESIILDNILLGYTTRYSYSTKDYSVRPLYRLKDYVIDARTLDSVSKGYNYYLAEDAAEGISNSRKSLSEAEIKGIEETKNVLPLNAAIELYNSIFNDNITADDVEVSYNREVRSNYYLITLMSKEESKSNFFFTADVWGRIKSYYLEKPYNPITEESNVDRDKVKDIAQKFVDSIKGNYEFTPVEFDGYSYIAYVIRNGIISFDEYIRITVDEDMEITSANACYYPDEIYDIEEKTYIDSVFALKKAEEKYSFSPYYYIKEDYTNYDVKFSVIPVYGFDTRFSVDARTGAVLSYNGEEIEDNSIKTYKDLNNQWYADYAIKLAYMGYSFEGDEFKGNDVLTLGDIKKLDNYRSVYVDTDEFFKGYSDESLINRYDFASYIAAGLGIKVVKYNEIYVKPYEDVDFEHTGAVAVLKAMGVVNGDTFRGNDNITRGEAAAMIYRSLVNGI